MLNSNLNILLPPVAYSQIYFNIYRSSHPSFNSFNFLLNLNLKTIICCDNCDITNIFKEYCLNNNINLLKKNIEFNQEPFIVMNEKMIKEIISICLGIISLLSFFLFHSYLLFLSLSLTLSNCLLSF